MKGLKPSLIEDVPRWVFRGSEASAPRFDSAHDTLSVLFFNLADATSRCKKTSGYVVSAETVLQKADIDESKFASEVAFREALAAALNEPCRFQGDLSPIVTSQYLALPYVQQYLRSSALFSGVTVAVATNEFYNFRGASPPAELAKMQEEVPEKHVQVPDETNAIIQSVTSAFSLDGNLKWRATSRIQDHLHFDVLRAIPRGRTPDASLIFNRRIEIDRVAGGGNRIFSLPKIPHTGDVRIPRGDLIPMELTWELKDEQGAVQKSGTIDLANCTPPLCASDPVGVQIDLFHPAVNPLLQSSGDEPPGDRTIEFRVAFRLDTKGLVYDHLYLQSSVQQMALASARPASTWLLLVPVSMSNRMLSSLWLPFDHEPPDGGLSQSDAIARLRKVNFAAWLIVVLAFLAWVARAANRARVYRFEPRLEWTPAAEITVDLNHEGKSRLLAGSLTIRNGGGAGWLSRWLGTPEQPTRIANVTLAGDPKETLTARGIDVKGALPVGFWDNDRKMVLSVNEVVSDRRQIHLFLAEEAVSDYRMPVIDAQAVVQVQLPLIVKFERAAVESSRFQKLHTNASFNLRIVAEKPKDPSVTYVAETKPLYYDKDARLPIGRFVFKSKAGHEFALAHSGNYSLSTSCEGRPLPGTPVEMPPSVTVKPHAQVTAPVELVCSNPEVRNPAPAMHRYTFLLQGPHVSAYKDKALSFDLHRDPARSEIVLHFKYQGLPVEVYWNASHHWDCRTDARSGVSVENGVLRFSTPFHYAFRPDGAPPIALGIEVGNSAKNGKGSVEMKVDVQAALADDAQRAVHLNAGWEFRDVVQVLNTAGEEISKVVVKEGDRPRRADVFLRPAPLQRIDGGEIDGEKCHVRLDCRVRITTDRNETEERRLGVEFPLQLEQLPGSSWLVIDFGTSAVAAAMGTADRPNQSMMLDLQNVKTPAGKSIASEDSLGPEFGTPFLPSWILCDADDRRQRTSHGAQVPPGFPDHTGEEGASLDPRSPSYVTLPPLSDQFEQKSERVILSLKSWLGINAQRVHLPGGEVSALDGNGRIQKVRTLPLDALLESSYAALAEAYIKPWKVPVQQVILCHPNTFSDLHRQRLQHAASKALTQRLDLIAPKHIQLLSESDAVAYWYCWKRLTEGLQPSGKERILVYDLGAGTLDLSVIQIEWNNDPVYPIFRQRHHLGVPVAGNYFDQVLARIIHDLLSRPEILGTPQVQYSRPVVATQSSDDGHYPAARWLWNSIRKAKSRWNGTGRFEVRVGETLKRSGVVHWDGDRSTEPVLTSISPTDSARLVLRGDQLMLSIPADTIASDPRVVKVVKFITEDVIDEALAKAGLSSDDITRVIVSGRGALWPGLAGRVADRMRKAQMWPMSSPEETKAAVAIGAVARQDFADRYDVEPTEAVQGRLAIIYGRANGVGYKFEDQWGVPIEIPSATFRLVQVNLTKPDPVRDLAPGSLRRHFYIGIGGHEYQRRDFSRTIRLKKDEAGGVLITDEMEREHRVGAYETVPDARASWPVGHPLLSPNEDD